MKNDKALRVASIVPGRSSTFHVPVRLQKVGFVNGDLSDNFLYYLISSADVFEAEILLLVFDSMWQFLVDIPHVTRQSG